MAALSFLWGREFLPAVIPIPVVSPREIRECLNSVFWGSSAQSATAPRWIEYVDYGEAPRLNLGRCWGRNVKLPRQGQ
jgi:hypothetical protein